MRRYSWVVIVWAFLCVHARAGASGKDLIVHERISGGPGNSAPREETQYFHGDRTVREAPRRRTIVDLAAKTVTIIRPDRQTYSVVTFDDLSKQSDELRQRWDNLALKGRAGMQMDAPISLKATGKTEKIAGYAAKEYAIEGADVSGSVWATDAIDAGAGLQVWQKVSGNMGGPRGGFGDQFATAMAKLNGFPLRTIVSFTAGTEKVTTTTEVTAIQETAAPAEVFAVPQGFKQVPTAGLSL
jgi:hypothetical protein